MRLPWNELRAPRRAASVGREWRDVAYEKGERQSLGITESSMIPWHGER